MSATLDIIYGRQEEKSGLVVFIRVASALVTAEARDSGLCVAGVGIYYITTVQSSYKRLV